MGQINKFYSYPSWNTGGLWSWVQKPLSSFHRDWRKNCGIGLQQIRHKKNTWQRTKWSYFSSFSPRIPWQMLCQAGDELCRVTKGRAYV